MVGQAQEVHSEMKGRHLHSNLPEGWASPKIIELLSVNYGKGLKKSERISGGVPVYGSNGIVGGHSSTLTKGPTMIIGRKGSIGAVNFSNAPCWPIDTTYFIDDFNGLVPEFIFYAFKGLNLADLDSSTAIPGLNRNDIYNQHIPLPPIAEQNRIVAKVEELLTRVNAARERLAKVKEILKRFRQSVLAAACSGRLTADWRDENENLESAKQLLNRVCRKRQEHYKAECKKAKAESKKAPKMPHNLEPRKVEIDELPNIPAEWAWVYLPDLGYMNRGKSRHRPLNASHLYGGPYPFIQTGDIAQSAGRVISHRQTYSEAGLAQSRMWPANTVCITIAANIANSAILTYPACFPDSIVGVGPDEDLCLAEYLEYFIRTAQADLDQFAPATSQKNINIGILSDVAVPLPPFSEQQDIDRRVEALFKLADAIEKKLDTTREQAEKLIQAVLAKAFSGELVPTEAELARHGGRSYEPAFAVLAKIKAQRKDVKPRRKHRVSKSKAINYKLQFRKV